MEIVLFPKRLLPNSAPIIPPRMTASAQKSKDGCNVVSTEITPNIPAMELTKINAAATPEITFRGAQCKKTNNGLRKIPPPTPVTPDKKPKIPPNNRRMGLEGVCTM